MSRNWRTAPHLTQSTYRNLLGSSRARLRRGTNYSTLPNDPTHHPYVGPGRHLEGRGWAVLLRENTGRTGCLHSTRVHLTAKQLPPPRASTATSTHRHTHTHTHTRTHQQLHRLAWPGDDPEESGPAALPCPALALPRRLACLRFKGRAGVE